jgi:hypothetical protein
MMQFWSPFCSTKKNLTGFSLTESKDARWHIFTPKIPICFNFGGSCNRIRWPFGLFNGYLLHFVAIWSILWPFGLFCGHLVYFMVIWYFFPVWVSCIKKNLATLTESANSTFQKKTLSEKTSPLKTFYVFAK